jgi:hypothetical protein
MHNKVYAKKVYYKDKNISRWLNGGHFFNILSKIFTSPPKDMSDRKKHVLLDDKGDIRNVGGFHMVLWFPPAIKCKPCILTKMH